MKQLIEFRKLEWLLALSFLLGAVGPGALAQDADPKPAEADTPKVEEDPNAETENVVVHKIRRGRRGWPKQGGEFHLGGGNEKVAVMEDLTLKAGETADQVVVIYGNATIDGDVDGNVVVIAGKAKINGKVGGELVLVFSTAELGPQAEIGGHTTVVGSPLKSDPAAKLLGGLHETTFGRNWAGYDWLKENLVEGVFLRPLPPKIWWAWVAGLIFFGLHFLIALLFPKSVQTCADTLAERPIRSFIVGVLVYILALPLLAILSFTVIGALLLFCVLIACGLLGKVVIYRTTGGQLGQQFGVAFLQQPLTAFLVGTVLFYLLYMVPILGWVVWFLILPLGMGAVVATALGTFRREGKKGKLQGGRMEPSPLAPASYSSPASVPSTTTFASTATELPAETPPLPLSIGAGAGAAAATASLPPLIGASTQMGLTSAELASLPRMGFWPRLGASLLDMILLFMITLATFRRPQFFLLLMIAYHAGMWVWRGTTLGGIVLGLKVVRLDGRPLDWPIALVRSFSSIISLVVFGLGFFWASWSAERQSWHDMIAGTTVVKLPRTVSLI